MNKPLIFCEECLNKIKELDDINKLFFKKYLDKHLVNDDISAGEDIGNIRRYRIGCLHLLAYVTEDNIVLLRLVPGFRANSIKG